MFGREKFGEFSKSSAIFQTKTIQISTINNLLGDLVFGQTIFTKVFIYPFLPRNIAIKVSCYTVLNMVICLKGHV